MTGGIAGTAAHLDGEALVVAEVTHLVGCLLGQELLPSLGSTVLHALKARPNWNVLCVLSWTA